MERKKNDISIHQRQQEPKRFHLVSCHLILTRTWTMNIIRSMSQMKMGKARVLILYIEHILKGIYANLEGKVIYNSKTNTGATRN